MREGLQLSLYEDLTMYRVGTRIVRFVDWVTDQIIVIAMLLILFFSMLALWDYNRIITGSSNDAVLAFKPISVTDEKVTSVTETRSLKKLMSINTEVISWLTLNDTNIDYPIVQTTNNTKYVDKDVFNKPSISGTIFLDYRNNTLYTDSYSILYGHHVIDGAMFSDLARFVELEYFNEHMWGELLLTDRAYDIELFACSFANGYDGEFFNPEVFNGRALDLVQKIKDSAIQYRDVGIKQDDCIIGFSTCTDAMTDGRIIVFGRLINRPLTITEEEEEIIEEEVITVEKTEEVVMVPVMKDNTIKPVQLVEREKSSVFNHIICIIIILIELVLICIQALELRIKREQEASSLGEDREVREDSEE